MGNSTVEAWMSGARNGIRTDACYKQYFQFASLDITGALSVNGASFCCSGRRWGEPGQRCSIPARRHSKHMERGRPDAAALVYSDLPSEPPT